MHYLSFIASSGPCNLLAIQTLAVALGLVLLGVLSLIREQGSQISIVYFVLTLSMGAWLFAFSRLYLPPDEHTAMWWARVAYFGVASIPAAVYHFSVLVLQKYEQSRKRVLGLWLLSAAFVIAIVTSDVQFDSLYRYPWGFYPRFRITSLFFNVYFFAVMIIVLRSFVQAYRASAKGSMQRLRARTLLIVLAAGYFGVVDFVAAYGIPLYPIGYVGCIVFIVVSARSILFYRFMSITPAVAARQIIDTMNDALIVLDPDGIIRLVNEASCALFGFREKDVVGKRPSETMVHHSAFAARLEAMLRGGPVRNSEVTYRTEGDEQRTITLSTSIMRSPAGETLATVCVVADITDRKSTEEEREKLIVQLQEALAKVKRLSGMLPICASCKKIRDDKGYWNQIEEYISEHSEAEFTHGLCPACAKNMLQELDELKREE